MNNTLNQLNDHRSIRHYTDQPVTDEQIQAIVTAAQAAPTWANGQQVSIIGVQDPEKREIIAQIAGGQPWIAQAPLFLMFCMDYYRIKQVMDSRHVPLGAANNVDTLLIGSTDVGLSMGFAITAAQSLGLGIVPIGGVRRDTQKLIELLDLPEYVFPVSGLVVGHPAEASAKKPRLPLQAFYHSETYNRQQHGLIEQYELDYAAYVEERSEGQQQKNWSDTMAAYYSGPGLAGTADTLRRQKFDYK
ncbi:NADPH-dependent oxidoreductase [Paenibacillus sp. JX-17]|uniref:NADPH-dependent oxidoreductase n=1 Tax=Paenibacillus lacisoli TaxID=3064525 RepID=A0ABT9CBL0_9BACL|nr:NADPH-dependent oxidoreductase [Paenibacillus sp. JX-17]MDO7905933.1 NADPH-dependent oxidoreductase [Paenibacillus sp. JX-17]